MADRSLPLRAVTTPLTAGVLLVVVYVGLSLLMSPRGYLGTDTGAKVATLDVMVREGTWQPDVGYWAEDLDPDGSLHPIYDARPVDGGWVHVTTLPMLLLGRPLFDLGGYRLTLLLPMLAAMAAAFASRALARGVVSTDRADAAGWTAFWVVGLASPMAVYALDFWEHAPGVACMLAAVVILGQVVDGARPPAWALAAGALLGVAATMRTEAFVYALVSVGLAAVVLLVRTKAVRDSLVLGGAAVVGFGAPWALNRALEAAVGGLDRGTRVSGATSSGGSDLVERAREAWTTLFAARPADGSEAIGLLFAGLVAAAVVYQRRGQDRVVGAALVGAFAVQVAVLAGSLNFVPGMLVAAPLATAGLIGAVTDGNVRARYSMGVAVGALPLVWAFQFIGGARPQWAGRYALTSCTLLVVLGAAYVVQRRDRVLRGGLILLSVLVTMTGVAWLHERSHDIDEFFEVLVDRPEDVIVVRNGFLIREGGPAYSERRWLTAVSDEDVQRAASVADAAGLDTFAVLDNDPDGPATIGGAELVGTTRHTVVGTDFYLHSYVL